MFTAGCLLLKMILFLNSMGRGAERGSSVGLLMKSHTRLLYCLKQGHLLTVIDLSCFGYGNIIYSALQKYSPTLAFFLFCGITTCNLNRFLFGFNVMDIHKTVQIGEVSFAVVLGLICTFLTNVR